MLPRHSPLGEVPGDDGANQRAEQLGEEDPADGLHVGAGHTAQVEQGGAEEGHTHPERPEHGAVRDRRVPVAPEELEEVGRGDGLGVTAHQPAVVTAQTVAAPLGLLLLPLPLPPWARGVSCPVGFGGH